MLYIQCTELSIYIDVVQCKEWYTLQYAVVFPPVNMCSLDSLCSYELRGVVNLNTTTFLVYHYYSGEQI